MKNKNYISYMHQKDSTFEKKNKTQCLRSKERRKSWDMLPYEIGNVATRLWQRLSVVRSCADKKRIACPRSWRKELCENGLWLIGFQEDDTIEFSMNHITAFWEEDKGFNVNRSLCNLRRVSGWFKRNMMKGFLGFEMMKWTSLGFNVPQQRSWRGRDEGFLFV
jgi:hypothetical protein